MNINTLPIKLFVLLGLLITLLYTQQAYAKDEDITKSICSNGNDFTVRRLDTTVTDQLCQTYAGKALLIVNTASRCGYTYQYEGLEKMYQQYKDRGLVVIGFPSNDFAGQEPANETAIKNFCQLTYNVKFPMYSKTRVTGDSADPLYQALYNVSGQRPAWNFHKYLINKKGQFVQSFKSEVEPKDEKLVNAIETIL